jgi:hypothetical protein
VGDNSLGPISILQRGTSSNIQPAQGPSLQRDPQSKLVLSVPIQKTNQQPGDLVNMNNTEEYGYDQPLAPKS